MVLKVYKINEILDLGSVYIWSMFINYKCW